MRLFRKKRKFSIHEIDPDEIFLDSKNLPQFDTQQFEGRIEKPISSTTVVVLGVCFVIFGLLFTGRLGILQLRDGHVYAKRSEDNSLNKRPIFAHRGILYDRNLVELAWNEEALNGDDFPHRAYIDKPGFAHVLGYMNYPQKDKKGYYYKTEAEGKDGAEKIFNQRLSGVNGLKIEETNAHGETLTENAINPPIDGENIVLSIDEGIQASLYESIAKHTGGSQGYRGGAGVIMDIYNGEIIALTSYPEYKPEVVSLGDDTEQINAYFKDSRKPFMNRAVGGIYTPGSIVKPFVGLAALNEGVISATKNILSNGSLSIPNPYFPDKKSIFKDHGVFGYVDMQKAIAVSSDVYFYQVGGGYLDQPGLGILRIDDYARKFGIAEKTGINLPGEIDGVIPTPEWKEKNFKGDIWRVGDTYNTSIGQYGFQVTPVQMARATAGLARKGVLVTPTILKTNQTETTPARVVEGIKDDAYSVVLQGMRKVVTEGTAQLLNVPYVKVAGKTGTAQVGISKQNVNSWIVGYFPYESPRYAFALLMDYAPKDTTISASRVMRGVLDYMQNEKKEYFESF
jgi:penicillin-binding protein 2